MTIYSLYIFDRHCDCVYYHDWHRTRPVRPSANDRPGVHRLPVAAGPSGVRESIFSTTSGASGGAGAAGGIGLGHPGTPSATAAGQRDSTHSVAPALPSQQQQAQQKRNPGLPFDEEAKLVYGVVLSLRNMVKKLSGNDNEQFTSYKTSQYRLHLYETLTGYKFVLLSDPGADSLRFVLRQIHTGPFVDYVVRNPLIEIDSRTRGIDNDQFRNAVDRHIRSLTMFGP